VEPPGPIPNPEVKRCSADGSETKGLVRVGRRQVNARLQAIGVGLFFVVFYRLDDWVKVLKRVSLIGSLIGCFNHA
jgi:hypothetical protein